MPIISQQTKVALFRTYVNSLAYFSELKAGEAAIALFFKPRKGKLTDENRQTLSSATWETLELRDMPIQTYRWEGGKNTILLAHGWESNAARWQQLIKKLRKNGFSVVALDAPAHGESGSVYFSAILYAEMMAVVVKRFSPAAIIGHSVGGFATAYYATQNLPSLPTESNTSTPSVFRLILMASPSELNQIFDKFLGFFRASEKVKRGFYGTLEKTFGKPMTYFSIKELIKPLTIKGLIIHDKDDDVCTFVDAENIHANWQGSQLVTTEGYGHRLQNDKVNSLVVDYLKKELG